VSERGHGVVEDAIVSPAEQASEYLLMGLRISEGVDLERLAALSGKDLDEARIANLERRGFVSRCNERLAATPAGRRILNAVIAEIAA
jgi:oxygen-independent coproporphyrinogen-3 oxidase